jgi:hypothetical protein
MKFYFDVTETNVKTIAIEANDFEQALRRAEKAHERKEFSINRKFFDDVKFKHVQEEVEQCIKDGSVAEEEFEIFDCNNVVYNEDEDYYECPVCGEYIANKFQVKDLDYKLPRFCYECGTKLHY